MNVGWVGGLYERGLEQGLIPLLFLQKDRIGKEVPGSRGREERGASLDSFIGPGS